MPAVVCFTTAVHTKCEGMLSGDEIGKDSGKNPERCFSYLMTAQSVKNQAKHQAELDKLFLENCTLNIR